MADLVQTPANVRLKTGNARWEVAGVSITAGMAVYRGADRLMYPSQSSAEKESACDGVALTNADAGDQIAYADLGAEVDLGAVLVIGELYAVSAASLGGIAPHADYASTHWPTSLGYATAADTCRINISRAGVAKP